MSNTAKINEVLNVTGIRQKAEHVLDVCGIKAPPINVKKVCEVYDVKYGAFDFKAAEDKAKKPISGALITKKDGDKYKEITILTKKEDAGVRQRFTMAHELGHLFLEERTEEISVSFRGWYNDAERAADAFAANLLMPEEMVRKEHAKLLYPVLSSLSKTFAVSKPAMRRRLSELELDFIGL